MTVTRLAALKISLHLRPVQKISAAAEKYSSTLSVGYDGEEWNAKSISDLIFFAARMRDISSADVIVKGIGPDADEAVSGMVATIEGLTE